MGLSGEVVADEYHVSRAEQDAWAAESHRRAAAATDAGWFREEIVPITLPQRKGESLIVGSDEPIRPDTTADALAKLKPAFKADGTVTAGNAPGVNDGAAALVVTSRAAGRRRLDVTPMARIVAYATSGLAPRVRDDDAGRGRAKGAGQDRLDGRRRRSRRTQRGLRRAGRGRHARAGSGPAARQRPGRRGRARTSDWRQRRARARRRCSTRCAARAAGAASRRSVLAAATASPWRWRRGRPDRARRRWRRCSPVATTPTVDAACLGPSRSRAASSTPSGAIPPKLTVMVHTPTPDGSERRQLRADTGRTVLVATGLAPGYVSARGNPVADGPDDPASGYERGFAVVTIRTPTSATSSSRRRRA